MFLDFFFLLRSEGVPVSLQEYLHLLEAMDKKVAAFNVDDFYYLCRTVWIKNEQFLDRFDILFSKFFHGVSTPTTLNVNSIPKDWLQKEIDRLFSDEEKKMIEKLGGLEALMERLQQLLEEQKERHEGGSKWIGTGGTSPYGHSGYNPEGIRIGGSGGQRSAVKVWEQRNFRDYADDVELNTRNMKMALRRLRILTREGIEEELDLDNTIQHTCKNAGYLDIHLRPSRKNRSKVLLFFDVGGSMDPHVELCSQLFSAAKAEYKHLEFFYFHNCIYESVWKNNMLRWNEKTPTFEVIHKFNSDYRVIIVGDATMSPYELSHAGGSVEHYNDESGIVWLQRLKDKFPYLVWLNPTNEYYWKGISSLHMIQEIFPERMFSLTLEGLTSAMKLLRGKKLKV